VRRCLPGVIAIAATLSGAAVQAADVVAATPLMVLHCGQLIDAVAGKVLGPTTVIIEGKRIREIIASSTAGSAAASATLDLSNQPCLPGLIDSHVHLSHQIGPTTYTDEFHWNTADYVVRSTVYARRTLLAGFTTVRNLGDSANEIASLRNAIN